MPFRGIPLEAWQPAARDIRGWGLRVKAPPQTCAKLGIDESCKYPDIRAWGLAGGADLLGVGAMQRARHCLSLAAVAALTCGLGGNFPADTAYAENGLFSARRIIAVYRVDLAGFHLGDFY